MSTIKPPCELTFSDDFMFGHVLKNPDICARLIEILLHIKVDRIEYPDLQKTINPTYVAHGVRFDVYVKDSERIFEIEMQNCHEPSLGKRCRYYQSMIDSDNLARGATYQEMKESYILFFCKYDPFGLNRPVYTFTKQCHEDARASLDDKCTDIIYNCDAAALEPDREVRALLAYIMNNNAESDFTEELDKMVATGKFEQSFLNEYMARQLHDDTVRREAKQEGIKEGALQNALDNAKKMVTDGLSWELITKYTGITKEQLTAYLNSAAN